MKRLVIVGAIGIVIVALALALGFIWWRDRGVKSDSVSRTLSETARIPSPPAVTRTAPTALPLKEDILEPQTPSSSPTAIRPSFDVVRVNPRAEAVIAGRASPHALVTVFDNGQPIGSVTADRRGEWVLLPAEPLAAGLRELTLTAQSHGEEPVSAEKVVVLSVTAPPAPKAPPASALAVLVPGNGNGPSTPLQIPAPQSLDDTRTKTARLTLEVIDYTEEGQVSFAGHGEAGSAVRFYLDNRWVGEARVDAQGQWRGQPDQAIAPGHYTLRLDQLDDSNRVTARVENPFQRTAVSLEIFKDNNRLVVQPGSSLWRIARQTYGAGIRYTVIYQANIDQIRDPDLIYPGQIFQLP